MSPRFRTVVAFAVAALFVALGAAVPSYLGPGGDGVVGRLTLQDGSEFKVVQRYNNSFEPYTVDFYFRTPGSAWGWCYIEHEDTRWTRARLRYNAQNRSVEVRRGISLRAAYFIDRKTFALYGGWNRELAAPQTYREPPPERSNPAIQRTASKPTTDALRVCHPRFGCESSFRGLAVADLVSR